MTKRGLCGSDLTRDGAFIVIYLIMLSSGLAPNSQIPELSHEKSSSTTCKASETYYKRR